MKKKAAFFIALRYLWARAHEGGRYLRGAAMGIAVSLIPIIVTLIVADGMIRGILDRFLEMGTGHLQVFSRVNSLDDMLEAADKIKTFDGIRGVWPEMRSTGVLVGREGRSGVTVRAVESSFWDDPRSAQFLRIIDGIHKPETDRDMVLGETLANNIGARPGDTVRLMTIRASEGGLPSPRSAPFVVRGIISSGYNELDALWCIISWEGGKRILSPDQSSSSLLIKIDDPYRRVEDFEWSLSRDLGRDFFDVLTWKDLLRPLYNSYQSTRQLLLFIMALIVIVAAVNVSSATSMLALERQRDIAVLKISGSTVKGVTAVFLMSGFLTGLVGGIIGLALGLLIGVNINSIIRGLEAILTFFSTLFRGGEVTILDPDFYLETIPIIINWGTVITIGLFTIICSVLASWIPARRAGKLKPMELLRKT